MKTKHIWAPEDVSAGMIVCRAHRLGEPWKPCGWKAKWTYKVGFVPMDGKTTKEAAAGRYVTNHYCLIAMTDGMVHSCQLSKQQMADQLTNEDMIPMPWSWWLQMVRYLRRQTMPDAGARAFAAAHEA